MEIFNQILAPFILFIKYFLALGYNMSENYGLAIVFLSFAISLLLLPVFIFIEKAKKKDDAIKLKMQPLIDEIKRVYKGQERYYYLKTLNRQFNYSPFRAMIPVLSLLLQIPFFIAAYQYLEHFEPLKGVTFGFIKDLSQPDGLMGQVHFLPIAMTIINIITVYFYTRNGNGSERKQMLILAGVFLVLLFKLPSGLVLYWTMNNLFSFLRLFVTNPEVFKKIERQKPVSNIDFNVFKSNLSSSIPILSKVSIILSIVLIYVQLNWAFKHSFHDIHFRLIGSILGAFLIVFLIGSIAAFVKLFRSKILAIRIPPIYFFSTLFVGLYFFLAGKFYFTGENKALLTMALFFIISLQIVAIVFVIKSAVKAKTVRFHLASFLLIFVLIIEIFNTIVFVSGNEILFDFLQVKLSISEVKLSDIALLGLISLAIAIPAYLKQSAFQFKFPDKNMWGIYLLAVLYLTGLIFLWNPLLVFSSSPETFEFAAVKIFENNLKPFIIGFILSLTIYLVVPKKYKRILIMASLILVVISFIYSLVIPINLGSLQESRFAQQENLAAPFLYFLLEAGLLIAVFLGVKYVYKQQYNKLLAGVLIVLNVFLIGNSLYKTYKTGYFLKNEHAEALSSNSSNVAKVHFSQSKQNIVYYLADGFQGWYIKKIMDEQPELKESFEGFIWYPNTISESNYTHSSIPALLGGSRHSVEKMNQQPDVSIKEKITKVSLDFINKAKNKGFDYSSTYMHYAKIDKSKYDNFIPKWDDQWINAFADVKLSKHKNIWYSRLYENAIFYSVPLFLKPKIYNNQKWFSVLKKDKTKKVSLTNYNFVRLLPRLSSTKTEKGNFIYIHDHSLHNPWNIVTREGELIQDVTPYENNKWFIQQFAQWISWMKENNVYHNTKIVIVSDHGPTWGQYDGKLDVDATLIKDSDDPKKITDKRFWRLNALLLCKDFNASGDLNEDWRLMSNSDAPSIIFDENDPTKTDSTSRTVQTNFTKWESHMIEQKTIKISQKFEVSNNIFDLNNWERVD